MLRVNRTQSTEINNLNLCQTAGIATRGATDDGIQQESTTLLRLSPDDDGENTGNHQRRLCHFASSCYGVREDGARRPSWQAHSRRYAALRQMYPDLEVARAGFNEHWRREVKAVKRALGGDEEEVRFCNQQLCHPGREDTTALLEVMAVKIGLG